MGSHYRSFWGKGAGTVRDLSLEKRTKEPRENQPADLLNEKKQAQEGQGNSSDKKRGRGDRREKPNTKTEPLAQKKTGS